MQFTLISSKTQLLNLLVSCYQSPWMHRNITQYFWDDEVKLSLFLDKTDRSPKWHFWDNSALKLSSTNDIFWCSSFWNDKRGPRYQGKKKSFLGTEYEHNSIFLLFWKLSFFEIVFLFFKHTVVVKTLKILDRNKFVV